MIAAASAHGTIVAWAAIAFAVFTVLCGIAATIDNWVARRGARRR